MTDEERPVGEPEYYDSGHPDQPLPVDGSSPFLRTVGEPPIKVIPSIIERLRQFAKFRPQRLDFELLELMRDAENAITTAETIAAAWRKRAEEAEAASPVGDMTAQEFCRTVWCKEYPERVPLAPEEIFAFAEAYALAAQPTTQPRCPTPQWSEKEQAAISDLSKRLGVNPAKVLQLALRRYQLEILGPPDLSDKAAYRNNSPDPAANDGSAPSPAPNKVDVRELAKKIVAEMWRLNDEELVDGVADVLRSELVREG